MLLDTVLGLPARRAGRGGGDEGENGVIILTGTAGRLALILSYVTLWHLAIIKSLKMRPLLTVKNQEIGEISFLFGRLFSKDSPGPGTLAIPPPPPSLYGKLNIFS